MGIIWIDAHPDVTTPKDFDHAQINTIPSKDIMGSSKRVIQWIRDNQFECVAIHLDLDVLDPKYFRSLLFSNPSVKEHIESEVGKASLQDISAQATVVGISFAEHIPWDALNLKNMLDELSFMR